MSDYKITEKQPDEQSPLLQAKIVNN